MNHQIHMFDWYETSEFGSQMFYTTDLPVSEIWKSMQLIFNQYCNYSDYMFFDVSYLK